MCDCLARNPPAGHVERVVQAVLAGDEVDVVRLVAGPEPVSGGKRIRFEESFGSVAARIAARPRNGEAISSRIIDSIRCSYRRAILGVSR